jgi:CheY-like chemotaxis protein
VLSNDEDVAMDSLIVLCIDDRREVLELRKAALAFHDFSVETALSGPAAIKMLEGKSVDVVLLEYKQEGMDAEAIAYQIKQRFPNLPIILLSAYTDMPERILWLVDEYVMKSELPEGLVRAVERVTRPTNTDELHRRRA